MTAIRAKVVRINPNAQTGSRTVAAYLAVQKDEAAKNNSSQRIPQLRPGLFLQGSILTGNASQLAVPLAAVRTDKPLPYVQVLQAVKPTVAAIAPERTQEISSRTELRVIHKTVELGRQSAHEGATWVQILKGLNAGDRILAGSTGGLREGTLVEESAEPVSSGSR